MKSETPENALGNKQTTSKFRVGDFRFSTVPKKIVNVLYMNDEPFYRYILEGLPNVSYSENELKISNEKNTKFKVKKIIGKKIVKDITYYLIHWKGYLKKDATFERKDELIKDGFKDIIDNYDK